MAEIKKVALKDLHANPFRDIEDYPILREKVDTLKESYETVDLWPSIIARKVGPCYEIAFGHHRTAAAIELWGKDQKVDVIVMDLSNDQMLKMMANENSEDWGSNFFLATMQPIAAVVKAFGDGEIDLGLLPDNMRDDRSRTAPSFISGDTTGPAVYSSASVGRYLGWVQPNNREAGRVSDALSALELIEKGGLNAGGLQGLSSEYAQVIIVASRDAFDRKKKELAVKEAKKEEKRIAREQKLHLAQQEAERKYLKVVKEKGEKEAKAERKALKAYEKAQVDQLKEDEKARAVAAEEALEAAAAAATEKFESLVERVHNNEITTREITEETRNARTAVTGEKGRIGVDLSFKVAALAEKLSGQSVPALLVNLVEALYDPANVCPIKDVRKLAKAIAEKSSDMSKLKSQINKAIRRRTQ